MLNSLYKTTRLSGQLAVRRERDRAYLMRLTNDNLLLPFYLEAGLRRVTFLPDDLHDGWDSPISQIRGNVLGHWLSAAAQIVMETGDMELKARADFLVQEIARCQTENGDGWCFSIPEKYLLWIKRGKRVWAPHYVCHKTMMGLLDIYKFTGSELALQIVASAAEWFTRYTSDITKEQMARMMWDETGAMMELFADLYAITKDPDHLELMRRYERTDLFELLEAGEDALCNMHANSSVPEIHGAARAYEVTGEERYRKLVERYWELAVTLRGTFVTGSQTSGEAWTPIGRESARLSKTTQEHCLVYNMMRLADYLFRWTGQREYADYWERNLYNGLWAQGFWMEEGHEQFGVDTLHPKLGYVAYHLPLGAGARKVWGSATKHFWCCHCTLMQANAFYPQFLYYREGETLTVAQYQDSDVEFEVQGKRVHITQRTMPETGDIIRIERPNRDIQARPDYQRMEMRIAADGARFQLALRCPWWLAGDIQLALNGQRIPANVNESGFAVIDHAWSNDTLVVTLPRRITVWPLKDRPDAVAFLDGPVALAGMTEHERTLYYKTTPEELLVPHDERIWDRWLPDWQTIDQPVNIVFKPLYAIGYETYTTYFPVRHLIVG